MTTKFPFYFGATEITFRKAKRLRRKSTPAEDFLWQALRNRNIANFKFRRQHPIGPFIVDFFCHAADLVVEVDGAVHDVPEIKEYDLERETVLKNLGLKILRFKNEDVLMNLRMVLEDIEKFLVSTSPSPRPSPSGRGSSSKRKG